MASSADMLALVRTLPVPEPWDRTAFIDRIARLRGRPIRLVPTVDKLAQGPCGLWMKRDNDDIIIHEAGTSEYHIDQIVCHEIGHMVLEHDGGPRGTASASDYHSKMIYGTALAGFDPDTGVIWGRIDFDDDRERDAEMFASMVMLAAAKAAGAQESMMSSVFFRR